MKQILSEKSRFQVWRIFDWVSILACVGILLQFLFFVCVVCTIGTDATCGACIWTLRDLERCTGWTYEALNVVLFIILEPLAIGFNMLLYFFHKYTFSHVLMAIGNIAAFLLVVLVNFRLYIRLIEAIVETCYKIS